MGELVGGAGKQLFLKFARGRNASATMKKYKDFLLKKRKVSLLFDELRQKNRFFKKKPNGYLPHSQYRKYLQARNEITRLKKELKEKGFSNEEIKSALKERKTRISKFDKAIAERIKKIESASEENKLLVKIARFMIKKRFPHSLVEESLFNRLVLLETRKLQLEEKKRRKKLS